MDMRKQEHVEEWTWKRKGGKTSVVKKGLSYKGGWWSRGRREKGKTRQGNVAVI